MLSILIACFLVMLVSFTGKLVTWRGLGKRIENNLHFFVSFAAGVMLMIAVTLCEEIIEHSGSIVAGLPWIALGSVTVLVAFRYIPQFHHHHDNDDHQHSLIDANRILVSDAVHNITDGAVITIAFAAPPIVGIASTLSIMVHEMLQEISEFFVYREAGLSTRTALIRNFFSSSTILIGAIGAYWGVSQFEAIEIPLLGLAVGSYLIVVFHDLIPHSLQGALERHHIARHLGYFLAGLTLMLLLQLALPHGS